MIVTREYTKKYKIRPIVSILMHKTNGYGDVIFDVINREDPHEDHPGYIGRDFHISGGEFTILPSLYKPIKKIKGDDPEGRRDVIYMTGPSGCGKSYQSAIFAKNYKEMYPENSVVLISHQPPTNPKKDALSLYNLNCIYFDLRNPNVCESNFAGGPNKLDLKELEDSLVIFDDYENIRDKVIYKGVFNLILDILFTGRHYRCSALLIRHTRSSAAETAQILTEAQWVNMYPGAITAESIEYFANRYCGISKKQMKEILHDCHVDGERYMYCHTNYPLMVVTDHSIRMIE